MSFADIVIFLIRGNLKQYNKSGRYDQYLPILLCFIRFYNYPPSANCTNLIYHRIVNFSGSLVGSIFLCKVIAARERQVPFH